MSTWTGRFRSVLKCYSLWIKWVIKFLILWSDEINHSNFENATKCLNKSWWYLLKHACFILKLKDLCNTFVHFQWKKTNASRHTGILSALRMRCACVVCMTSASSWPNCVSRVAIIKGNCIDCMYADVFWVLNFFFVRRSLTSLARTI